MDTTLERLLIKIEADTKGLKKGLDRVNKELNKTEKKSKKAGGALKKLRGVLATIGGIAVLNQIVQTNRTFEDLEATLRAVTGSAEAAKKSFELIRAFTSTTTFQIEEVAQAFITLKQAGIVPTSEVLQDFGNFAAGMGKSVTQLAQAAFNATTGEMEMLKQFGVIARQQGDKITVTFDGVTKTIDRSGEAIVEFLRSIGREKFPTAIEERFNTLSGAISNLKDQISEFNVAIGDGVGGMGLRQNFINLAKATASLLETLRPLGQLIGMIIGLLAALATIVVKVIDGVGVFARAIFKGGGTFEVFAEILKGNITTFEEFAKAARGGADDVSEIDKAIAELLSVGQDFKTMFTASELTDFKLFEQLKKQVIDSRRTVQDLIENEMTALRTIIERTLELQLKLSVAQTMEGDDVISRILLRGGGMGAGGSTQIPFDVGGVTTMLSQSELAKRREDLERALLGGVTIDEFLAELQGTLGDGAEDVTEEFNNLNRVIVQNMGFTQELQQTVSDAANAFTTDFVESLANGENALRSFRDFAGDIVNQIVAIFLQLEVVNRILGAIFPNFTGQQGTGLFQGNDFVGPRRPFKQRLGSLFGTNASGGVMQKGMPRLVGERGAELFIPHAGGTLMNNMNTKGTLGGSTTVINQNISFSTGIVPTVRAEVTKMLPQIADVTKGAVQEAAMRGGSFRRSLVGG
jgi:hypothetical protein